MARAVAARAAVEKAWFRAVAEMEAVKAGGARAAKAVKEQRVAPEARKAAAVRSADLAPHPWRWCIRAGVQSSSRPPLYDEGLAPEDCEHLSTCAA